MNRVFVDGCLAQRVSECCLLGYPRYPKPVHLMACARRMLEPVFAWFRARIPTYTMVRDEDEKEMAYRLLGWLRAQRVPYDGVHVGTTLGFWWSFVDVDVDMEGWGDRMPLLAMVTALMDGGFAHCPSHLSDSLARAVRLRTLDRLLASPCGPTWAVQLRRSPRCEMQALGSLRHRHVRLVWVVRCTTWRLGLHVVLGPVLTCLFGGHRWMDVLAVAEAPTRFTTPPPTLLPTVPTVPTVPTTMRR